MEIQPYKGNFNSILVNDLSGNREKCNNINCFMAYNIEKRRN